MGGRSSSFFTDYATLCTQALTEIRKHAEAVIILMEIMTHKSSFPAFRSVKYGTAQYNTVQYVAYVWKERR